MLKEISNLKIYTQFRYFQKNDFTIKLFSCQEIQAKGNKEYSSDRRNRTLDGNMKNKDHEKNKYAIVTEYWLITEQWCIASR